jgi:hypothetical protein
VLKNENNSENLPAVVAWKIDEKQVKFVDFTQKDFVVPAME